MKKGLAFLTIAGICALELISRRRQSLPEAELQLPVAKDAEPVSECCDSPKQEQQAQKCYYIKGGVVWHQAKNCRYIAGKNGITAGTVQQALAQGKQRACALCGE